VRFVYGYSIEAVFIDYIFFTNLGFLW